MRDGCRLPDDKSRMLNFLLRDRWIRLYVVIQLVLFVPYALPLSGDAMFTYSENWAVAPPMAMCFAALIMVARAATGPERRFWKLLTASYVVWAGTIVPDVLLSDEWTTGVLRSTVYDVRLRRVLPTRGAGDQRASRARASTGGGRATAIDPVGGHGRVLFRPARLLLGDPARRESVLSDRSGTVRFDVALRRCRPVPARAADPRRAQVGKPALAVDLRAPRADGRVLARRGRARGALLQARRWRGCRPARSSGTCRGTSRTA